MANKLIYSFFGGPGSGKGTLANTCKKKLGFDVLSTGNLCRKHILLKTDFGIKIDEYLKKSRLIPDELIINLVKDWLDLHLLKGDIILDGYPRTIEQADALLNYLELFLSNYNFKVINFVAAEEILLNRLSNRFVCVNENCQSTYNSDDKEIKKGYCSSCGEKILKREDDNKFDFINKRVKKYPSYRDKLLEFYIFRNVSVVDLNAEKLSKEVFEEFLDKQQGLKEQII